MRRICLAVAVVLLLGCLISVSVFADSAISLRARASGQLAGNQADTISGVTINTDVATGFAIGLDALYKLFPYLQIGGGLEYQLLREVTYQGASGGSFQFVPIYGIVRVPFAFGPIEPYVVGRIGYGIYSGDSTYTGTATLNGGLYFAAGAGVDYKLGAVSIFAEATYAVDDGSMSDSGVTLDTATTGLDVSVGVSFSF
jgi:hypothetical protein